MLFLPVSNIEIQIIRKEGMKEGSLSMAPKYGTLPKNQQTKQKKGSKSIFTFSPFCKYQGE